MKRGEKPPRLPIGKGCPPGAGTIAPAHGGRIGNPPHIPTDEGRDFVRENSAKIGQRATALTLKISVETLQRHYRAELDESLSAAVVAVSGKLYEKAMAGDGASIRFFLITRGGGDFSPKVKHEHTGAEGGPIKTLNLDSFIAGKSEEELAAIESVLEQLATAGGLAIPGDGSGGAAPDQGGPEET